MLHDPRYGVEACDHTKIFCKGNQNAGINRLRARARAFASRRGVANAARFGFQ